MPPRLIRTGLDYAAVGEVIRTEGLSPSYADIREVETAALDVLTDQ